MSISTEISRLQQAKSDLATSITNKGVTVPAATTLDGYAALVDQIQQGGGTLPYDAEIAYLESSGTQYIDTGIYVNGISTVLKMRYSGFTNKYFACGCRTAYNQKAFGFSNGGNNFTTYNKYFLDYNAGYNSNIDCPNNEMVHDVVMNHGTTVDNKTLVNFAPKVFTSERTMWIFGANNVDGVKYGYMRIYSCQIYDGGDLVRDLIPVRVGQVGCMYDRVSKTLLYNQGTGSFILGHDVNSLPYDSEVEYLQGDGSAYIDTGIKAAGNLCLKTYLVDYFTSSFAAGLWVFGGRNAANNNGYGMVIATNTEKLNVAYNGGTFAFNSYSSYPQSCWVEMQNDSINVGGTRHTFTAKSFTSSYNLILFGLNNGGTKVVSTVKIGRTIVSNGTDMLDLVPVRVGSVGYFYDKMSKRLIGNANSTGAFTLGPDVT